MLRRNRTGCHKDTNGNWLPTTSVSRFTKTLNSMKIISTIIIQNIYARKEQNQLKMVPPTDIPDGQSKSIIQKHTVTDGTEEAKTKKSRMINKSYSPVAVTLVPG